MKIFSLTDVRAPKGGLWTLEIHKIGFYTVSCDLNWVVGGGF